MSGELDGKRLARVVGSSWETPASEDGARPPAPNCEETLVHPEDRSSSCLASSVTLVTPCPWTSIGSPRASQQEREGRATEADCALREMHESGADRGCAERG